jgi:hypothetical protein
MAGQRRLHHVERAGQVGGQDAIPMLRSDLLQPSVDDIEAGIVDQDVDASEAPDQASGDGARLVAVGDVERLDHRGAADAGNRRGDLLQLVAPPSEESDSGACAGEHQCPSLADSRPGTGHPDRFPRKILHRIPPAMID